MKFLIVDDERSYGSLLASALKKIGHRSIVHERAEPALAAVREGSVDAAFIDLVMPDQSGSELARALRSVSPRLPIAFCAGSAPESVLAQVGDTPLLPRVWTVDDVRRILRQLRRPPTADPIPGEDAERLARGSGPLKPPERTRERRRQISETLDISGGARVVVRCRDWEHVEALCRPSLTGKGTQINIRARQSARIGQRLSVVVTLPNELGIAIESVVKQVTPVDSDRFRLLVLLEGMDPELAGKLMGVMKREGGPPRPRTG